MSLEEVSYLFRARRYVSAQIGVPIFSLHDSVLFKRFDRTSSFFDRFPYQLLAAGFFERTRENLSLGFGRNHQDAINIAEDNIPWKDADGSNLNRYAEVDHLVARGCVLPVGTKTKCGKAHVQNRFGISHVAIQNGAAAAQLPGSGAHEFPPERVSWRGACVDIDFVGTE